MREEVFGWRLIIVTAVAALLASRVTWVGSVPTGADAGDRTEDVRRAIAGGQARNVILFIGDGMGDSEITLARNYAVGAGGRLALDTLPLTGAYTTYSVQERDPSLPDYVPDSAATGRHGPRGRKRATAASRRRPERTAI